MESYETDAQRYRAVARDLVLAMMASASTDKIRAMDWWPRAKAALMNAAESESSWGGIVTRMARRLQIDMTTLATGKAISSIEIPDGEVREFAALVRREAVYIVAAAQIERDRRRDAPTETDPTTIPVEIPR